MRENADGHTRFEGDETAGRDLDRMLTAVAAGQHEAFDQVYAQLRAPVHGQVCAILRDRAQADEVTQEVLLELWATAFRYDPARGSAAAWALMIARRRAIDRVRSAVAATAREHRTAGPAARWDQGDAIAEVLDRERLLHCMGQLTERQREAITLAFYRGNSYSQVAAILGIPVGTVKARIRSALTRLRSCIASDE